MISAHVVDLTNCDREPIHIPGAIQPHGCLIACDASVTTIRRVSVNSAAMLGLGDRPLQGQRMDTVFGERLTHDLRNALAGASNPGRPGLLVGVAVGEDRSVMDVSIHSFKGESILEFEPASKDASTSSLEIARTLIARLGKAENAKALTASIPRLMRALLNYDRVMVYRFAEDGSGEVISEAKRNDLESFLGQHFPASDIPRQARQLYIENTIRVIGDVAATPVPVLPQLMSNEALDLSFAHLRAVSPIHCEYLRNMGVGASMSVSILINGNLWGLIACHHYSARYLSMPQRVAAEMFGQFFAMNLEALNHRRSHETAVTARRVLDTMLQQMSQHLDVVALLRENVESFQRLIACDGVGFWIDGIWDGTGTLPPEDRIAGIARFVNTMANGRCWATNALSDRLPSAHDFAPEASGLLAIPLSQIPRDYIFFFRKEVLQTVNWAGDPNKQYQTGPQGDRLTPRKSFAIWKQTVERQSKPWTESDRDIAEASRGALVEIVMRYNELLADERSKSEVRQKILNEELNHRVKNILALIKSLVSHPVDAGRKLPDYIASLRGRIQALAFAHDQVVRGSGGGQLSDLLSAELSPYRENPEAVVLEGPPVQLDSRAFSVMALVLHELATNAAKYGALSTKRGRLVVRWRLSDYDDCEIAWDESDGPPVKMPSREGFGSVLLSRSVPFDLGGVSDISYPPSGLKARLMIPGKYISRSSPVLGAVHLMHGDRNARERLPADTRVLLVEDQLIIALDVEAMLIDLGAASVETASSVDAALASLKRSLPDLAVLDINLGTETSWPIAAALREAGVPFVLASGYGDLTAIPGEWAELPVIRKPYDRDMLLGIVVRAVDEKVTN